ncbi:MAG: hypothetical protein R3B54_09435 [Bdellovibrionota bacterium]
MTVSRDSEIKAFHQAESAPANAEAAQVIGGAEETVPTSLFL